MPQTLACPSCRAATRIDPAASMQRCDYCGFEFVVQATQAAAADAERRTAAALEPIRDYLNSLIEHARQAAADGDQVHARNLVTEYVAQHGRIYRETGYFQIMGLADEQAVVRYESEWLEREVAGLAPNATLEDVYGQDSVAFGEAIASQDFERVCSLYRILTRKQMANDPEWRDRPERDVNLAIEQAVANMCVSMPWVSDEQLASLGVKTLSPSVGPDGQQVVACGNCSATLKLESLAESVTCPFCEAVTRIRLTEVERYHARGHHEVTAEQVEEQQAAQRAHANQDVDAAIVACRSWVTDHALGSPRYREQLHSLMVSVHDWLAAGPKHDELLAKLGLGPPRTCRQCGQSYARALDGDGTCPCCGR